MFSGIIEDIGEIDQIHEQEKGRVLTLSSSLPVGEMERGESLAVDGVCLTLTDKKEKQFQVFVSHETLGVTTLGDLKVASRVNLERSLAVGERLDGHMVQGHVDAKGKLIGKQKVGDSLEITLTLASLLAPLVVPKGSIAVDGISLTINSVRDEAKKVVLGINLIPYTLQETTLGQKEMGCEVNLETDILGRYVQRLLQVYRR